METPEAQARQKIDTLLTASGWVIQDVKKINLSASMGIAVREFPLNTGFADYLLFIDKKAVGAIEAKKQGTTLSAVHEQTSKYLSGVPANLPHVHLPLPFGYESTGIETFFTDRRDPAPCARPIFSFHTPEHLQYLLGQNTTLRSRLASMPPLISTGLRDCQVEAVTSLEKSFADARPRALIQMATGAGKTYTAVTFAYRLIKHSGARRILFLVDRTTLGKQTLKEFQQYVTPDDGRKFTELYNVQHLTSNTIDPVCRVTITTIQRLYSMLSGAPDLDPDLEENSAFDTMPSPEQLREIAYNPKFPIDLFDFIVTDECHRSIYNLWRQVLEYFDSFLIGLTATPSKQTIAFFNQNLVTEYNHARAVADGVNVGYEVYRIKTRITSEGSTVESGSYIDKRDRLTRKKRWELLDEDFAYPSNQLDRDVVATDQIRTIISTYRDRLFTDIFPGRSEVPKTLIFAKSDSHAEDIVHITREVFGKGNDFCKKITYRANGEKPEDLIASFRNSYNPRIAVTVDMISTGTDIKPLECLIFMRDVKSPLYFEQMKGRGTRTISTTDFNAVTPDATHKTHFVIIDAVGVCERDFTDSQPLERKKSVSFDKLMKNIAFGIRDKDTLSSMASRLARLSNQISDNDKSAITKTTGGTSLNTVINGLLKAVDPDAQLEKAQQLFSTDTPTKEQLHTAFTALTDSACAPFDLPDFRDAITTIKTRSEQTIDHLSQDQLLSAGHDDAAKLKAQSVITTFKKFIEDNRDEITALQIIYSKPYRHRHLTYEQIRQLADTLQHPPYNLTPELLWLAYERLDRSKVRGAGPHKLLTDIISILRFTIGEADILEPFTDTVAQRFDAWLASRASAGQAFTPEQLEWLTMIRDHIATSLAIEIDDFDSTPFHNRGGAVKAYSLFGDDLPNIINELNEVLAA